MKHIECFALVAVLSTAVAVTSAQYVVNNLVSDGSIQAPHTDANLVNPWGLAFGPTTFNWVANNHTGVASLYDGTGVPQQLVVTIPGPGGAMGAPSGAAFYPGSGFDLGTGPMRFLFAGEDGIISG